MILPLKRIERWNTVDRHGTALKITWKNGERKRNEGQTKYNQLDYPRNEEDAMMGEEKWDWISNSRESSRHIVLLSLTLKQQFCLLWNGVTSGGITKWIKRMYTQVGMKCIADRLNRIQNHGDVSPLALLYYNNRGLDRSGRVDGWTFLSRVWEEDRWRGATSDNRCSFHRLGVKRFGHSKTKGRGGEMRKKGGKDLSNSTGMGELR